jgi:hypothetical protein
MSFNWGKKPTKQKRIVNQTLQLLQGLQRLEDAGALHINRESREVHLIRSLFWDKRALAWRQNFTKNVHFLMDRNLEEKSKAAIHIFDIDIEKKERGEYITSYLPSFQTCKQVLEL